MLLKYHFGAVTPFDRWRCPNNRNRVSPSFYISTRKASVVFCCLIADTHFSSIGNGGPIDIDALTGVMLQLDIWNIGFSNNYT